MRILPKTFKAVILGAISISTLTILNASEQDPTSDVARCKIINGSSAARTLFFIEGGGSTFDAPSGAITIQPGQVWDYHSIGFADSRDFPGAVTLSGGQLQAGAAVINEIMIGDSSPYLTVNTISDLDDQARDQAAVDEETKIRTGMWTLGAVLSLIFVKMVGTLM